MNHRLLFLGLGLALGAGSIVRCVGDAPTTEDGGVDASVDSPLVDSAPDVASGCDARVVDEASGVFVNINGTDSAQCGGAASPCRTVQVGVNQAKVLSKTTVYIARGTYVESVATAAGLTLEGGWDTLAGKWIPACGTDLIAAAKLQMPDTANVVVSADFAGTTTLRYLTLLPKTATAAAGESVYGVFAHSANVVLDSTSVTVGAAGTGANGDAGAPGTTGGIKCATSDGADGGGGTTGTGADGGFFGATGYVSENGSGGQGNGATGHAGTCSASCSGNEVTICKPNTTACSASQGCANPLAGCGGTAGGGGFGGLGGGSSIGVFGWDATFTISGGSMIAGNGGNGGVGGGGGPGGAGGSGSTEQELCSQCVNGTNCATVGNTAIATGSKGGSGGTGGSGGGGAGGFSYGIYAGGDGGIVVQTAPLFQHGSAGTGGTPNGTAGQAADRFPP